MGAKLVKFAVLLDSQMAIPHNRIMKEGPDIAAVAALIADPARANILCALMSGMSLSATELSHEAGVTAQTTSSHLAKLCDGGLLHVQKQGRHRYFCLADDDIANLLENLMGLAHSTGHLRTRPGPKDPELRYARRCYGHLAGTLATDIYDQMIAREWLRIEYDTPFLTVEGAKWADGMGLDVLHLAKGRAPLCKSCLDWSTRRHHLAGALGRALYGSMLELAWIKSQPKSRTVTVTPKGNREIKAQFFK